jgi:hypothetical protein
MPSAQNVSAEFRGVGDYSELRVSARVTAKCEDSGLVLDDVDVDEPTSEGHHASSCVDRIFVLVDENNVVKLVCTHLVAPEIVEIQNVGFPGFSSDHAHTLHVRTGKHICR